ncbi:peptidyl-prolyl cis-trans isomerase D [Desulfonatronum thiosulfatophilum]|uniref:Periplasmic chaperone PpiD n=1 Tax=Desulfonatronum thiosulfatophilum TaxID=617002 RepID=A0A1G6AUH4_9BACT|nr:SurA N-terminal domain-containing protein [Desulfonatronum thiosulfatophilum]SDB11883.1 peptidyl-prolyl cis-trans isomerase D [Desulfonatronum thiosulfatophilum]
MLDAIRRNAQSWGVKVIFGIIILVFVFWGVGSFRSERGNVLAEINESPLLLEDFQRVYRQTVENLRRENPGINIDELERMDMRGQIFGQMVNAKLMEQEAARLNLSVSTQELRQAIYDLEVFHDQEQQFDPVAYRAVLRAYNLTPAQFEADFRRDLKIQRLQEFITLPAAVSDQEVRDLFTFAREEVVLSYLSFPWNHELAEQFEITEEAVEAHYQANLNAFQIPARMRIAYLNITPSALADPTAVTREEILDYYNARSHEYTRPEQVWARHILITPSDATEEAENQARDQLLALLVRIQGDENFEDLAREYSEDASAAQGGDLGWFGRGEMIAEFEDAAFELQAGQISSPVRSPFGWHLIQVEERREESTIPLEEVAATIRARLAEEHALEVMTDALDVAMEQVIVGSPLDQIAEQLDLEVQESNFFAMGQSPAGLNLNPEAVAVLFGLDDQEITQTPILMADGYLLAQRIDHEPQRVRTLDEVRDRVVTQLRLELAKDAAQGRAESVLDQIRADTDEAYSPDDLQRSSAFGRQGFIPGLGFNTDLASESFAAAVGEWLPEVYQIQDAFIVARLEERFPPTEEQWAEESDMWRQSLLESRQNEFLQAFVGELQRKADIRIVRPDIISPAR